MSFGVNDSDEYRFGDFVFDATDNTLRNGDKILPLTPKSVDLLRVFIANQGKLLSKAELMNILWRDSFVEESNLAVTIRHLRKALADDARHPLYIETVARQGYRFIADVKRNLPEVREPVKRSDSSPRTYLIPVAAAAALLITTISLGALYVRNGTSRSAPILEAPFAAQRLSTSGRVESAAISRDGERVVYTVRSGAGESVWLREVASANNVEIIPASGEDYYNLDFSPDGNTLYFTRGPRIIGDRADLFSVSIFGGVPQKLVSSTRGWISVSPDGERLSFVRCPDRAKENCSLWTANSEDGKNEKMVASRPRPLRITDHEFAPDGKSIVFASGQSENSASEFGLITLDLETGVEREVTPEKFFNIRSLEILPENDGILLTGSRGATRNYRVWKIDYTSGSSHPLTKDSVSYSTISLDDGGTRLITTQVTYDYRLFRADLNDLTRKETLTESVGRFAVEGSGDIVFQSESTGDIEIWRMNADGAGRQQLTSSPGDDGHPIVSSDGTDIYFTSNRSGGMHVWRMKPDGSGQIQVTTDHGGMPLFAAKGWVYYQHARDRTLWRVSIDVGTEEPVLERKPYRGPFAFSPSGTHAAFVELIEGKLSMVIASIPGNGETRSFELVDGKGRFELAWLPNETAVAYTLSDLEGEANILWIQPLDGGAPYKMADLGDEEIIFLSFLPQTDSIALAQGRWKHDAVMLSGLQ